MAPAVPLAIALVVAVILMAIGTMVGNSWAGWSLYGLGAAIVGLAVMRVTAP